MMGRLSTVVLALVTFVASGCTLKNLSGHALKDGELTFGDHDFGARCFDAFGCRIAYNGMYLVKDSDGKRSPPLRCSDLDSLAGNLVGIDNFPPPAHVAWTSIDGEKHEADVDVASIFRRQVVLHSVPRGDMDDSVRTESPAILVVVNNRDLLVYMRPFIWLRKRLVPGNPYSQFNNDLVLAYKKTF